VYLSLDKNGANRLDTIYYYNHIISYTSQTGDKHAEHKNDADKVKRCGVWQWRLAELVRWDTQGRLEKLGLLEYHEYVCLSVRLSRMAS